MKNKFILILCIFAITFSFFSCMTNSSGEAISFGYTPQEKYKIGRTVGGSILGTYSLYYNKNLYTYLNSICNSIIINSDGVTPYKGYSIGVLNTNEINAFATPGGHILISRGMLKTANTEDELAAIIAHEISHIQLEHSIKAIKKNDNTQTVGLISTALTSLFITSVYSDADTDAILSLGESLTNFSTNLINTGYSKKSEFDADKNAILLMQNTGYNPEAMINMLVNLKNNKSKNYSLGFGKTHPSPKKRIRKVQKEIKKQIKEDYSYNEESRLKRFEEAEQYF